MKKQARLQAQRAGHSLSGNCWASPVPCIDGCQRGAVCDVCHKHDEPRGECSECGPCKVCETETKEADRG